MDPRERAEAILARARARGAYVVTPESATSPMDAANTLQIPRSLVAAVDRRDDDPEATMVVPVEPGRHRAPVPAQAQPPPDEGPAIAQEASTQVLANPAGRRPREAPPTREEPSTPPMSWAPPTPPPPAPPPEPVEVEGLVPTVKQPPRTNRSSLSQRLDG